MAAISNKLKKEESIKEDTINFINQLKNEPKISTKIKRKLDKKNKPKVKLKENKIEEVQYIKEEDDVRDEPIVNEPEVSDDNDYVKELESTDKSETKITNKVDMIEIKSFFGINRYPYKVFTDSVKHFFKHVTVIKVIKSLIFFI